MFFQLSSAILICIYVLIMVLSVYSDLRFKTLDKHYSFGITLTMLIFSLILLTYINVFNVNNYKFIFNTAPIIFTMYFMTIFEYIFVRILNNSIKDTIKRKMMYYLRDNDDINVDTFMALYTSSKTCNQNEKTLQSYVGMNNLHFTGLLFTSLTFISIFYTYRLKDINTNELKLLSFNTGISISMILFLFLFYYVNISSKMQAEYDAKLVPQIMNILNFSKSNYKSLGDKRPETMIYSRAFKRDYKKPVQFCQEYCDDHEQCLGYIAVGKDKCKNIIIDKSDKLIPNKKKYTVFLKKKSPKGLRFIQ